MKHKSEYYKLIVVEYYLVEDKSQEDVCKIFKCSPRRSNFTTGMKRHNIEPLLFFLKQLKKFHLKCSRL